MADPTSIGRLISRQNVEQAVVGELRKWLPTYLREVESQNDLGEGHLPDPPSDDCYSGGIDTLEMQEQNTPAVIVQAVPDELAMRFARAYLQWYSVTVTAIVWDSDFKGGEDAARARADWYGAAVMGVIVQSENLDGFASQLLMEEAPATEFVSDDLKFRNVTQTVCEFRVLVQNMATETGRPPAPTWPPLSGPTAETLNLTVTAVPEDQTPVAPTD